MSRAVIRLGDEASHGGRVINASARMTIDGILVALWGDHCSCPHDGHDNCVICEGGPQAMYDGIPVALEGHKTSCGATLIASLLTRCHVSPLVKRIIPKSSTPSGSRSATQALVHDEEELEQCFAVMDEDGKPVQGLSYHIKEGNHKIYESRLGADGATMCFPVCSKE